MSESVLLLDRVVKVYGDFKAKNHISLNIPKGSIYGFPGPNCAGEATMNHGIVEAVDRYCVTLSLSASPASLCESKPQCTQRRARRSISTCFT